jgi:uncharacterized protein YkwD
VGDSGCGNVLNAKCTSLDFERKVEKRMLKRRIKGITGATFGAAVLALSITGLSASTASAGGCPNAGTSLDSLGNSAASKAFICLFNQERNKAVQRNGDLATVALKHSNTMRDQNCLAHECQGEPELKKRVKNTGYLDGADGFELGEIIAFGVDKSPNQIVKKWLNSSDHRELIRRKSFEDVGVGVDNSGNGAFVTAVFGSR